MPRTDEQRAKNREQNRAYRARLRDRGVSTRTRQPLRTHRGVATHVRALMRTTFTDTCWIFCGRTDPQGYGKVDRSVGDPGTTVAHRIVYEALVGPVASDMTLDHLCRNTSCVNPTHMEVVTRSENTRRARA